MKYGENSESLIGSFTNWVLKVGGKKQITMTLLQGELKNPPLTEILYIYLYIYIFIYTYLYIYTYVFYTFIYMLHLIKSYK